MTKIEHKYDIGQIVLIPMMVDSVKRKANPDGPDTASYELKPINDDNAVIRVNENGKRIIDILDEKYVYCEYKGEVKTVERKKPADPFDCGLFWRSRSLSLIDKAEG